MEYAIFFTVTDAGDLTTEDMGLVTYRTKPTLGTVEDAYSGTNVFATFLAYDRYVILRPSLG